ncbi:MAG: chemotaxis protein CheA, partial [Pseudomonadota bacterium]
TQVDEAEIRSVFEFVEGLCAVTVERVDDAEAELDVPEDIAPDLPPEDAPPLDRPVQDPMATAETASKRSVSTGSTPAAKTVVRVDLDRIERLVNLVGELVINQAMLSQSLESAGLSPHSDAMNGLDEFQRLTRDIQDSVMMIRAQPVKPLFQRMSRIVRESSAAVGKDVRLLTDGDATEVDKTVIERLADPLTHMIRNAVDHGLEAPHARADAGKSPEGTVNLSAAHRSGRVVIEVSDDGAGINRPKVQQIAIDKGLIPTDAVLSDGEIDNLLFLPGFSTASSVSDLSGRGVGMDVVKTAIQSLGGRFSLHNSPGTGSRFQITLPLTLAVLDGMTICVGDDRFILPLSSVVEALRVDDCTIEALPDCSRVLARRGEYIPLVSLRDVLDLPPGEAPEQMAIVVDTETDGHVALLVDELLGQRQVVLKSLEANFQPVPGVSGATILGDGRVALILDVPALVTLDRRPSPQPMETAS